VLAFDRAWIGRDLTEWGFLLVLGTRRRQGGFAEYSQMV